MGSETEGGKAQKKLPRAGSKGDKLVSGRAKRVSSPVSLTPT